LHIIDKWLVENGKEFVKNTKIFPNKISRKSMGCTVKVATRVFAPIIVEQAQGSKEKYSGIELNILRRILGKLNCQ
jgi:hypothetical protein